MANIIKERRIAIVTAWGFAFAISSAVSLLSNYLMPENYTMQRAGVLSWQFVFFTLISGIFLHIYLAPGDEIVASSKVVKYISTTYMESGGFVARSSPWLQQNLVYAVVLEEDEGFERILGAAKFVMAQDNKMIQLMVVARNDKAAEIWRRLDSGETDQLKNIKLKMGMPHE